jgi:KDO2-lipid IV(A) lauroyltransferase
MLYLWYSIAIFISLRLPLSVNYRLARWLAHLVYLFNPKLRRTLQQHLRYQLQATNRNDKVNTLAKNTVVNFFKYLVDFFQVPKLTKEYISSHIPIYGKEHLDTAIADRKRIIILSGHIGNWELGAIAVAKLGYRMTVIALDHPDRKVNKLFLYRRKSAGIKVFPPSIPGIRECYKALETRRIVGLVGDLEFGTGGVELDWFGEKVRVPKGPAMISRRTGAVVLPAVMVRQPNNKLAIYIDRPIESQKTDNPEADILANVKTYCAALGKFVEQYPDQWYRFR